MDSVSPVEAFVVRLNVLDYSGSVGAMRELPIGGLAVLDADVDFKSSHPDQYFRTRQSLVAVSLDGIATGSSTGDRHGSN